jgi:hypothetical protein
VYVRGSNLILLDVPRFYGANIKFANLSQEKRKQEQWHPRNSQVLNSWVWSGRLRVVCRGRIPAGRQRVEDS